MKAIAIYISAILVLTSNICGESFANSSKATTMQRNQIDQILNKADDRLARLDTNAIQLLNKANSMLRGASINALSYRISLSYGNYYKIKNEFKLSAENYYRALELASDTRQKIHAMIAIGELNRSNSTYYQGIQRLKNAMNIIRHETQFATEKARIYDRLAAINYELTFTPYTKNIFHPLNIAIAFADSAIAIAKPLDFGIRISCHNIRGAAYIHLKNYNKSNEDISNEIVRPLQDKVNDLVSDLQIVYDSITEAGGERKTVPSYDIFKEGSNKDELLLQIRDLYSAIESIQSLKEDAQMRLN